VYVTANAPSDIHAFDEFSIANLPGLVKVQLDSLSLPCRSAKFEYISHFLFYSGCYCVVSFGTGMLLSTSTTAAT